MLSGETAKGKYPIEAVKMMAETAYLAENAIAYQPLFDQLRQLTPRPTETAETLALSAVAGAIEQDAGAIIVLSTSYVDFTIVTESVAWAAICAEDFKFALQSRCDAVHTSTWRNPFPSRADSIAACRPA